MKQEMYKGFKKVAEDEKTATMAHENGHKLQILKSKLSPKLRDQLAALPLHQNDPQGAVQDPTAGLSDDDSDNNATDASSGNPVNAPAGATPNININVGTPDNSWARQLSPVQGSLAPQGMGQTNTVNEPPPVQQPSNVVPMRAPQNQPPTAPAMGQIPGYSEQVTGEQEKAQAEGNLGNQQAKLRSNSANQEQNNLNNLQNDMQDKWQEIQSITQDVKDGHIDPNHYLENRSTGQKISNAIGLILGGMGAGLTGGPNPALEMLNKQIDRDIESQRANLGQKSNLLSALTAQYKDRQVAENMFKATRANILADQIQAAADKSADPLAKARAKMAVGEIQQKYFPLLRQSAALQQLNPQGSSSQAQPAQKISLMKNAGLIDDKQYEQANKELGDADGIEKLREGLKNSYDDLNNSVLAGSAFSPSDRSSAINTYAGLLNKAAEGRFNLQESQQQIAALLPASIESGETREKKLQRMDALLDGLKKTPTLDGLGVTVPQRGTVTVINPSGKSGIIDRAQLKEALSKGYKRAS